MIPRMIKFFQDRVRISAAYDRDVAGRVRTLPRDEARNSGWNSTPFGSYPCYLWKVVISVEIAQGALNSDENVMGTYSKAFWRFMGSRKIITYLKAGMGGTS